MTQYRPVYVIAVSGFLVRGTQIAYLPAHAHDLEHPDVQFGFVTSAQFHSHFCRFWKRGEEGMALRTTTTSENVPNYMLIEHKSAPQEVVNTALKSLYPK